MLIQFVTEVSQRFPSGNGFAHYVELSIKSAQPVFRLLISVERYMKLLPFLFNDNGQ